ncbi:MAG: succinate dehydrogenase cytochrome b subunit [Fibrobacter sp.]|nr:succinate dehydrogenase cytochrome b subunit [Fibrobacter sp.]
MQWIIKYLTSSIGKKQIMGCTGAFLALFVLGHMCGNFQLLNFDQASAQASYNAYTQFLTSFNPLHFPVKLIYLIELVLVAAFALHIFLAVTLKLENKKARGDVGYEVNARKGKKTFATFTMIWSGLFVVAFLVQHLMMLKFGEHYLYVNAEGEIVRDMWLTTIQMFAQPAWAAFYVISMFVVGMHLFHAIASAFQTMGIAHQKWTPIIDICGIVYSVIIALGFGVTAVAAFYLANQPATQELIEKSRALQPQYEQQQQQKAAAEKAAFVIPSVGEVQVSFNID